MYTCRITMYFSIVFLAFTMNTSKETIFVGAMAKARN